MRILIIFTIICLSIFSFACEDSLGIDPMVRKDIISDDSGSTPEDPFRYVNIRTLSYLEFMRDMQSAPAARSDVYEIRQEKIKIDSTNGQIKIQFEVLEVESMVSDLEISTEQYRYDRIKSFILKTDSLIFSDSTLVYFNNALQAPNSLNLRYRSFKNTPYEKLFSNSDQSVMQIIDRREFGYVYVYIQGVIDDITTNTFILATEFKIYF